MTQTELFEQPKTELETRNDSIIDAALHHVQNQQVLRDFLSGKSWGESFGIGGRYDKFGHWQGDSKGITIFEKDGTQTLIKPTQILNRARQYKCMTNGKSDTASL
jgi:hypothetical protein